MPYVARLIACAVLMPFIIAGCEKPAASTEPTPTADKPLPMSTTQPAAFDPAVLAAVDEKLKTKPAEVLLDRVTLEDAIAFVADTSGVKIDVDWAEVVKSGVARTAPISTRLRNVRLSKVLQMILESADRERAPSNAFDKLMYTIRPDGHIVVSTRRALFTRFSVERRYDIADLVRPVASVPPATAIELREQVRSLITDTVAVGTWVKTSTELGGTVKVDGDTLVVVQDPEAHQRIDTLLATLREQRPKPDQPEPQ